MSDMTLKEKKKWEERHFQVCLALINRTEIANYGLSKPMVDFKSIIHKADELIFLLKKREKTLGMD